MPPGFYARVAIVHVQGESLKTIAPLLNETVLNTRSPRTTLGGFFFVLLREGQLMTDNDFTHILINIPNVREDVMQELRDMAAAKGNYTSLECVPLWMRDIWLVAAELLERDARERKKPGENDSGSMDRPKKN